MKTKHYQLFEDNSGGLHFFGETEDGTRYYSKTYIAREMAGLLQAAMRNELEDCWPDITLPAEDADKEDEAQFLTYLQECESRNTLIINGSSLNLEKAGTAGFECIVLAHCGDFESTAAFLCAQGTKWAQQVLEELEESWVYRFDTPKNLHKLLKVCDFGLPYNLSELEKAGRLANLWEALEKTDEGIEVEGAARHYSALISDIFRRLGYAFIEQDDQVIWFEKA